METGKEYYARVKQSWSKPVDEDSVLVHLSELGGDILCGIDKRHIDIYNYGIGPVQKIKESEIHICKLCFKIYNNEK